MYYSLKSLLFIFIFLCTYNQHNVNEKLIYWNSDNKLNWGNFRGKAKERSNIDALTTSGISSSYEYINDEKFIKVSAYFSEDNSWVKSGSQSNDLLNHEQLHFDIRELYARKLRKIIGESSFKDKKLKIQLGNIYHVLITECDRMQIKYDDETDHSKSIGKQIFWDSAIAKQLVELKSYENELVKIRFK